MPCNLPITDWRGKSVWLVCASSGIGRLPRTRCTRRAPGCLCLRAMPPRCKPSRQPTPARPRCRLMCETAQPSRPLRTACLRLARWTRDWRARQDVTTRWACAHKAEQRSLARQARCNRAQSAVTRNVLVIEAGKVNLHAAFLMFASGQLRFPGLSLAA